MKTLIVALLVLALSVFVALAVKHDNGYILIGYGNWSVEGSLAFFVLLDLLLFGLLYAGIRLLSRFLGLPRRLRDWRRRREAVRARKALTQGLVELSEGHWKSAEKNLVRHARQSETPLLNYLAAARSAQQQGAYDRRDHYLQLAHESMPSADVAVGLTQAELQLAHEQLEQALATLKHLRSIAPRHTHVLKLLKELYERLGDWEELYHLLPELKKRRVVGHDELEALELKVCGNLLDQAARSGELERLDQAWRRFPASARGNQALITRYAGHLMDLGQQDRVEKLLRETISRHWNPELVERYSRVDSSDLVRQLSSAEGWLKAHPRDPVLLLTLGRLSLKNRLWGKARSYLEASIGIEPGTAAYRELGALLESMGEPDKAMACYRAGLELVSDMPLPELPAPPRGNGQLEAAEPSPAVPTDVNPPQLGMVAEGKA
ncbi:MAG TPA: heme biosynthesis protein HemY [Sedimenticola thiotaurini]|uniref:Heme biosynthesis protein HemY n=1 Tax=Sedimenticola thiotaurini TaxID=1543721 RepID=A0A831RK83_9GAMM|nr:heme biosynthesis protein HemY [Sedimenticola thiotaurini]